jgi:LPS-assembly lipoprotein
MPRKSSWFLGGWSMWWFDMRMPQHRRTLLLTAGAAAFSLTGLAGCGFALRRAPELQFRTVMLKGFGPKSPLAQQLRTNINASRTTLAVEDISQAQVVFEALADARETSVAATTAAGQVRELQLRSRLQFRLQTVAGKELIPRTEILLSRTLSYNENAALAKEEEQQLLFRGMEADIVAQVMRRLAAIQTL